MIAYYMVEKLTATICIEFSPSKKTIVDTVKSLTKKGLINIDYKYLKEILSNNQIKLINLTTPKRVSSVELNELVKVLDTQSKKFIVDISGGSSLTLSEVEKVIDLVTQKTPDAYIMFGAHILPKLKNSRKIVLITN